jgi:hypothetical protein
MEAMLAAAIAVALQHYGGHVVVEHLPRHAAESEEGVLMCMS